MEKDTGLPLSALRADGGASRDAFLLQFQADILDRPACARPSTWVPRTPCWSS
ncbi:FGGY-family carbohydrate kinase [Bifidobacterium bifidum]|uniref:FGGY-family carbohydrate kinase n=1 Tax=Bifidobacterium bifidum TaxID=1681 RepID=UPI003D36F379